MALHNEEDAVKFGTRKACQAWIDSRIVRFKLRMVKHRIAGTRDEITFVPQKCDGSILNILDEDFKKGGTDEPLRCYAEPSKRDGSWVAFMKLL